MSLLTICQQAADEIGIARPSAVASSTDQTVRQLMTLASRSGKLLAGRRDWTALQTVRTFTTTAAENQGAVKTLLPGYRKLIGETGWDASRRFKIQGPMSPVEYERRKIAAETGTSFSLRILNGNLLLFPAPTDTTTQISIEYVSDYWATKADGTSPSDKFAMDTDVSVLDEDLITLELVWRFKRAKGFAYGDEQAEAEQQIVEAMADDGGRRSHNLAGGSDGGAKVPQIPEGWWNP